VSRAGFEPATPFSNVHVVHNTNRQNLTNLPNRIIVRHSCDKGLAERPRRTQRSRCASASDRKLADTVVAFRQWSNNSGRGDAAYQAMHYHFQPRAKAIAHGVREPFTRAAGDGVMIPPGCFFTCGRRVDSVWHTANSHLLRGA
jgi:hypothetical protein